jgi:hypothetical protein
VLENEDFGAWSSENCVCAVGHDGAVGGKEDHKPKEEVDPKTKEKSLVCPSYLGLTCDEHKAMRREFANPPSDWGKIPPSDGVPNNWVVGPDGVVEKLDNKDAAVPKSLQDALTAHQKKYEGKPIPFKKYEGYRKAIADGDKALEDGKWKAALAAYLKVDADAKKLSKGLVEKVAAKLAAVNEKVAARFAETKDGEGDVASKMKAVKALRADVGQKFSTGLLPVVADLDAWIKENAAALAPAK